MMLRWIVCIGCIDYNDYNDYEGYGGYGVCNSLFNKPRQVKLQSANVSPFLISLATLSYSQLIFKIVG